MGPPRSIYCISIHFLILSQINRHFQASTVFASNRPREGFLCSLPLVIFHNKDLNSDLGPQPTENSKHFTNLLVDSLLNRRIVRPLS